MRSTCVEIGDRERRWRVEIESRDRAGWYLLNIVMVNSCGRSPDRATDGHGQETGPSYSQILRKYAG